MATVARTIEPEAVVIVDTTAPKVAQTSLAARGTNPGEVTVRFRRWTMFNNTAYQTGTYAGFPEAAALRLASAGAAVLDPGYLRRAEADFMVRK